MRHKTSQLGDLSAIFDHGSSHHHGAHGVVVSHPLSMREALGSIPSVSMPLISECQGRSASCIVPQTGKHQLRMQQTMSHCASKASTPCGTRTRNLRIRSPTPCPLGQGGLLSMLFCATMFLVSAESGAAPYQNYINAYGKNGRKEPGPHEQRNVRFAGPLLCIAQLKGCSGN